jgi:hypothetical protein
MENESIKKEISSVGGAKYSEKIKGQEKMEDLNPGGSNYQLYLAKKKADIDAIIAELEISRNNLRKHTNTTESDIGNDANTTSPEPGVVDDGEPSKLTKDNLDKTLAFLQDIDANIYCNRSHTNCYCFEKSPRPEVKPSLASRSARDMLTQQLLTEGNKTIHPELAASSGVAIALFDMLERQGWTVIPPNPCINTGEMSPKLISEETVGKNPIMMAANPNPGNPSEGTPDRGELTIAPAHVSPFLGKLEIDVPSNNDKSGEPSDANQTISGRGSVKFKLEDKDDGFDVDMEDAVLKSSMGGTGRGKKPAKGELLSCLSSHDQIEALH